MLKQKTQYGILSIIIIALLGFVLPSFWKYQAKQLGVNPNYFHIGNNLVDFANLTTYSLLLFGIIGAVISYIVSIIIRNKLIEKIKKEYSDEKILCKFFPQVKAMSFVQFMIGGYFFGQIIFPFFLSNEITHIDMVTRQNLLLYFLYGLIGFVFAILFETYTVVLTNKRLIGTFKWLGTTVLPLTDIKKIKKDFWGYNIISKNNTNFPLKCSGQAKKCAKKLIHLIGQEI